jgi:hypothetical protein
MSIEDEHTVQDNQSSFMTSNPQPFKASLASYNSSNEARQHLSARQYQGTHQRVDSSGFHSQPVSHVQEVFTRGKEEERELRPTAIFPNAVAA